MANIADIEAEARDLVDADSTEYPAATLLRRENAAYEEVVALILGCDGQWQFDDTRYSSFPIATTNLIAGQRDYAFDSTVLEVEKVAVLYASDGLYHFVDPFDLSQLDNPVETLFVNNGIPRGYDKQGGSLVFDIAPSATAVTLTNGLKVYFKRSASIFTSAEQTTGTATPGFFSPAHLIISYKAALPYALKNRPERVPMILRRITELENLIIKHYSRREQDRRKGITTKPISFR